MKLLLLLSARLSPFQAQVLESLRAADHIQLAGAVIQRPAAGTGIRRGRLARLWQQVRKGRGGYVLVMGIQSLLARCSPRGSSEIPAERFFDKPAAGPIPIFPTDDLYSPATLAFIRQCQPDCIFRSGFGIIREPVLSAAPRGVISYHHGDLRKFRGLPPAFWELYTRQSEMRVTVQQLTAQLDAGRIVNEIVVPIQHGDSWSSLHRRAYAASVPMIADACRLLADPDFQPTTVPPDELGPLYTLPNLRQWLALQWRVLRGKMGR